MRKVLRNLFMLIITILMSLSLFSSVANDMNNDGSKNDNTVGLTNALYLAPATEAESEVVKDKLCGTEKEVLFLDNGQKYTSEEVFMKEVGYNMMKSDQNLIFYTHYIGGAPTYIFSNRTSRNILHLYID